MSERKVCDECGRGTAAIKRVYKGHRYCPTCYARVFKRRLCPKCGEVARLPKDDLDAICRKCEVAKPCIRCGKSKYSIGKITPYGPVCNACSLYFREEAPCESCGRPSKWLTRVSRFGHDLRLCPRCARSDHGTCPACRRHRLLFETGDGSRRCRKCLEEGEIPCPSCGELMPAGRGNVCELCYWKATARKRIEIDCAAFSEPGMREAFGAFGAWLIAEVGPNKAAITIHRYLPFFLEVERNWKSLPDYGSLLKHFGAERLRRVRLAMRWLAEERGIVADATLREQDSDERRIKKYLDNFPAESVAYKALSGYAQELRNRVNVGKTSIRSMRLALSPAVGLLRVANTEGQNLPRQTDLDRFLLEKPGQRAAVTGFVNYLNRVFGTGLKPVVEKERVKQNRRRQLEKKLIVLAQKDVEDEESFLRKWIPLALEYFHGVRVSRKFWDRATFSKDPDGKGMTITDSGQSYWIPVKA